MQTSEQISQVLPLTEGPPPVTVFVEGHLVDPRGKSAQCSGETRAPGGPGRGAGPSGLRVRFLLRKKSSQSPRLASAPVSCPFTFLGEGDGPDVHV